jgi:hypothetical protein
MAEVFSTRGIFTTAGTDIVVCSERKSEHEVASGGYVTGKKTRFFHIYEWFQASLLDKV